jgi:hypothetical protein
MPAASDDPCVFARESAGDWGEIDRWWDSFERGRPLMFAPAAVRTIPGGETGHHWEQVDRFWEGFEADHELLLAETPIRSLAEDSTSDAWATVDEFWDSYAATQQADLRELQELMADLRDVWADGESRFDADPLSTNRRPESQYEGPLRTTINEEDWSQWLAHLLRTSSGPFVSELLGMPARPPSSVRREVVFFGDEVQRRVDILVESEDRGVSIEVKQGDEHYGKTPETAGLIEQHDRRDWSHVLLLQQNQLPRLERTFRDHLEDTEATHPTIRSDRSADIAVQFWRDVSRVLRRLLIDGREPDSHWEASAYLLITLIEQRVLGLHSFSFVESRSAGLGSPAPATDIHQFIIADPEEQIEYLHSILQEESNHE